MSTYLRWCSQSAFPRTPFTGAGHFGRAVSSGGQNQVLFPFYSRALGPTDLKFIGGRLYRTPPGACLPVGCGGGRVDQLPRFCQSRRRPHSTDTLKFLTGSGPVPPRPERPDGLVFARRIKLPIPQEGVPRKMGVQGGDAYEHRRKPGVRRRSPLGASLVTFCAYRK